MHRTCLVQGSSRGIGLEMVRKLLERSDPHFVFAACRDPARAHSLQELSSKFGDGKIELVQLDVSSSKSIESAIQHIRNHQIFSKPKDAYIDFFANVAGVLTTDDGGSGPERRLSHLNYDYMKHIFDVNVFGPMELVGKGVGDMLCRSARLGSTPRPPLCVFYSARVGSITDNSIGGW